MYAHYQNKSSKTNNKPTVVICSNLEGRLSLAGTYLRFEVSGKKEARAVAQSWSAKPWNF